MGRDDRRRRLQFFQPGELPLVLLALLDVAPRHGYELMEELGRLFGPAYRPSPGSVYPALAALVEERLIADEHDGGTGRRYRCTATGRAALARRHSALAAIEVRCGVRLRRDDDLSATLDRFTTRIRKLTGFVPASEVEALLEDVAGRLETRALTERMTDAR